MDSPRPIGLSQGRAHSRRAEHALRPARFDRLDAAGGQRPVGQRGFTLIELLVALAVFGLAALALLRLQGVTLRTAADLDRRALAGVVARNLLVETLSDPAAPALGEAGGVVENGGRRLAWTRTVVRDGDPRFVSVTIGVGAAPGASPAVLSVLRPAQ